MTTWIAHLRVAENLLPALGPELDVASFAAGSVGPDSGVPTNAEGTAFDPPKKVTHWMDEQNICRPDLFHAAYLAGRPVAPSNARDAFLLGYYVHLVTDVEWFAMIYRWCDERPAYRRFRQEPQVLREAKRDWYDLDLLYLRQHPGCLYYTHFAPIAAVPDYLGYLPAGALTASVARMRDTYAQRDVDAARPFPYLTASEMDAFVVHATTVAGKHLASR